MTDRLADRLTDRLTVRLADRLTDRLTIRLTDRLADRLTIRLTDRLTDRLADRLTDRLTDRLNSRMYKLLQMHACLKLNHTVLSETDFTTCTLKLTELTVVLTDIVSDFSNMRWWLEIKIELKFHRL